MDALGLIKMGLFQLTMVSYHCFFDHQYFASQILGTLESFCSSSTQNRLSFLRRLLSNQPCANVDLLSILGNTRLAFQANTTNVAV